MRVQLREEIRRSQLELGVTTVFVTHEQVASPDQLYERPATTFVAELVGTMNRVPAVRSGDGVELLGVRRPVVGPGHRGDGHPRRAAGARRRGVRMHG